jgi:hypothetical protein
MILALVLKYQATSLLLFQDFLMASPLSKRHATGPNRSGFKTVSDNTKADREQDQSKSLFPSLTRQRPLHV